ncbi:MAG: 4-hydroxy-3-methylbut-2-enyl diphosphate reductase [Deltaproteobacteria bacterium]|jgi:4-hydroxy-3-methylbut-2-enyl diphosphate reductase|nr:4-hydroxy-3-methylbut-2-enyl diphosphate reductase [Deltaproteobacteria bacterium]
MKVILAKSAGFCMGVRRAVETTLDVIQNADTGVSTFGPLIHNPQVLNLLGERGVKVLKDIPEEESGTVIIRAHGVPPVQKEKLRMAGAKVKDATCPHVVRVQVIIRKYLKQGYGTVIIGDRNHAEVEGLMGFAGDRGQVVSNSEDVEKLQLESPYIIVSQTTQDETVFEELSSLVLDKFPGGRVFNTICDATHKRQEEVRILCRNVEAMVVVGGKNSANTQRLAEIAEGMGCPVFLVETEEELDLESLAKFDCVGVTAGASTPTWMINRVVRILEAIPSKDESRLKYTASKLLWLLLATNIYVSLAGGALTYTAEILQNNVPRVSHFLISFFYLFAMHNLNRFTDRKLQKFNDPLRALFYEKYRCTLLVAVALSLALALTLVFEHGIKQFLFLSCMIVFGVLYSVQVIPKSLIPNIRVRGLKEIPGSKTFLVAVAWGFVTTLLPSWRGSQNPDLLTLAVLLFVMLLVFVRNALIDVFEVQGDRIVGRETLPVFIGEKKTLQILNIIMLLLVVMLLIIPLTGLMAVTGFWLLPGIAYIFGLTQLYVKGKVSHGPKLEFWLDSVFPLLAGLAWLSHIYR